MPPNQPYHPNPIQHAHVSGYSRMEVSRTFLFRDSRPLAVACTMVSHTADKVVYRVSLKRTGTGPDLPLSLYNLGLQGRKWSVKVTSVEKGRDVKFLRPRGNAQAPNKTRGPFTVVNSPVPVPGPQQRFRRAVPKGGTTPNEGRIWFLEFAGDECELIVESFRTRTRGGPFSFAASIVTDHDYSPPPPDPGGDDGEEGEEGGGDGEDPPEDDGE